MEVILVINGTDFTPWLKEGGLQQSELSRRGRSMVDLNGTEYRDEIIKRAIAVSLMELRDESWYKLIAALRTRPATVRYIDDGLGDVTKRFYISGPTAAAKTVRGGHTYFSGGTFTLEEK